MIFISDMWKEEIRALKFPYAVNSEEEAENILFKNSPERLVLLKWIYTLTSGLLKEISPKELADYFRNLGIVQDDPFIFIEGNNKIKKKKVWSNLFHFARMMKYSPEISRNFAEKHCNQMPLCCTVTDENDSLLISTKTDSLSLEHDVPNLEKIISTLEEQVSKPVVTSSGENNLILCKLKEYLNRLSLINAQIRSPESAKIKDQNEFGNYTADLYKQMQILETVLMSSSNVMSSMRQLEKKIDEHLLKSEDILELICKLKRFSGDF